MSKPAMPDLKHQEALMDLITRGKRKTAVSFWWLAVPLFMMAMLLMQQIYRPQSTFRSSIRDFKDRNSVEAVFLLVIAPLILAIANGWQIARLDFLLRPRGASRFTITWPQWLIIIISVAIIIVYLCI